MPDARMLAVLLDEILLTRPPEDQIKAISRFLPAANMELLGHSLKELRAVAKRKGQTDLPEKLNKVYHRKLAEQTTLYSVFHVFESAFRTNLVFWMEKHYGRENWWEEHLTRLRTIDRLGVADPVTEINAIPVTNGAGRVIENFIKNVEGDKLDRSILATATGHQAMALAKMSDVEELIHEHWTHFKKHLPQTLPNGAPLDEAVFKGRFKRVRDARNQAYHHREVVKRLEIVVVAEELLDLINVHLCSALGYVAHSGVKTPSPSCSIQDRHCSLPDGLSKFLVENVNSQRGSLRAEIHGTSTGDAISRRLAMLSGDDRSRVTSIFVVSESITKSTPEREAATQ